ncbi:hypothetical protein SDJN03_00761, partial [Cucurbita argyrosperma subsp. sororia]
MDLFRTYIRQLTGASDRPCPILYGCCVLVARNDLYQFSDESSFGQNATEVIDIQRSGATIAFDYFKHLPMQDVHGNFEIGSFHHRVLNGFERMRRLYEYMEDGDLWRWSLPNSKALSSGLKDLNIEYETLLNSSLLISYYSEYGYND